VSALSGAMRMIQSSRDKEPANFTVYRPDESGRSLNVAKCPRLVPTCNRMLE
jgi:hypothetical protein